MSSQTVGKLLDLKPVSCRDRKIPISLGKAFWKEGRDVEMTTGEVLDPVFQPFRFSLRLLLNIMLMKTGSQCSRKRESVLVFLLF